jgi:Cytochrome P450
MYPPVGLGQVRICHTHDLMLCGGKLFVPKGTALWVPHHAMHNTKHNWDQPEKFMPGGFPWGLNPAPLPARRARAPFLLRSVVDRCVLVVPCWSLNFDAPCPNPASALNPKISTP